MKEQIKAKIERIFDNPEAWHVVKNTYGDITIDEPILKVEWVADQILALFPQGEGGAEEPVWYCVLMKTLEENKKAIDELSQYLGNNSNDYSEESEMAKLCASYIDLVKDLDIVQEVYKSEDPGCLSIWTIVNTTPFDSKALAPVYKAQVNFYANRKDKLNVDIHVINRSEYPDVDVKEQMERVMGVIDKEQSDYGRENDGYKALEYVKQALKAELLEGENG